MDAVETTLVLLIALVLCVLAVYFTWRQRLTMQAVHNDLNMHRAHRSYWLKQTVRRRFGSLLMILLAAALVGSLFLNYEPMRGAADHPPEDLKHAARIPIVYWMVILLMVMAVLVLAIFDFWATARFGVQQQKQLIQEHRQALEAELAQLRRRQSELN